MKRIWFVSHYSMPPKYEMRIKTQMYAHYLNKMGYETKIFSASTIHNIDINLISDNRPYICCNYDGLDFVHISCHNYSGNGIMRISNMLEFSIKFNKVARKFDFPDVVVADVNCINYEPVYKFCKRNNIKFLIDMRDLWPMSIVEYYGYSKSNPIIKYLYLREKEMYKRADGIIFSMEGGRDYIVNKGWDKDIDLSKIHYINNGVDIEKFDLNREVHRVNDLDLEQPQTFKVVYAGSIRLANNLKKIVDAAKVIKEREYKNIKFLIYGDGDDKEYLERFCAENAIDNISFKGFIDKNKIPYILSKCNLNIIHFEQNSLKKYGASLNKMFEYFASGKPTVSDCEFGYDLINKYKCGVVVDNADSEQLAEAVISFYNMREDTYSIYCQNAIKAAKDFDYKALTSKLECLF
jgi:glycosyltransferase involved in cell wall biosynthesis